MAVVCPGSINVIGGQCTAIKTIGNNVEDMIIKSPVAIKAAMGENPIKFYSSKGMEPSTRMGIAWLLRKSLNEAKMVIEEGKNGDIENQAIMKVIAKNLPLKIHVHRADDIITAIRIAKEFNIDITLDHCTQGYKVIDEIKGARIPILLGPLILFRDREELNGHSLKNYAELIKSGIECAIISDHPVVPISHLMQQAIELLQYGISEDKIIELLTIAPARIIGVDRNYGSISVGKNADIVVYAKPKLANNNFVKYTIIDGIVVYDKNKNDYIKL